MIMAWSRNGNFSFLRVEEAEEIRIERITIIFCETYYKNELTD